jgi:thiol-disulfide isomerase/thioredoxin
MKLSSAFLCLLFILAAGGCADAPAPTAPVTFNGNDFTMNDHNGKIVSLSDFRGKVVVLDFWGSWCGPCIAGMPEVKRAWEKYRDREFMLIGIGQRPYSPSDRDIPHWKDYITENDLSWTHVFDGSSDVAYNYGIIAIPTMKLLDRDGNVIATAHHISQLDSLINAELEKID